jgi:vacuolar-type H+-ATPase subunit I/STV1
MASRPGTAQNRASVTPSLRPATPADSASHLGGSIRTRASAQACQDIKPAQIHELKLQTQQIQQQTLLLRTQLRRTEIQINSKTSAINQTFEQSSTEPQTSKSIHKISIPRIRRNIEGARNTLESLKEHIEAADRDDRTSAVQELEEELKMTYCEHQRLSRGLQDRRAEADLYRKQLEESQFRVSGQHIAELRASIRELRAENATLRDKANAYQAKIERMLIEEEILEYQKNRWTPPDVLDQVEADLAETNAQMNKLCEKLDAEAEKYEQTVGELKGIIEEMKKKIAQKLEHDADPPGSTVA